MKRYFGAALIAAYIGCVFGANWAGQRYGIVSIGFGMHAAAGLYFAGLALTLRDFAQNLTNRPTIWSAIIIGAIASYWVAPSFAVASAAAFLLSEGLDFMVYTPLQHKSFPMALMASNTVGAAVDSIVFIGLAFGWNTEWPYWWQQTIGKLYMAVPFALVLLVWEHRDDLLERARARVGAEAA